MSFSILMAYQGVYTEQILLPPTFQIAFLCLNTVVSKCENAIYQK